MYRRTDGGLHVRQANPLEVHGNAGKKPSATSAASRQKRPAQFSRPQLLREFELLMLTALVETARRDRSA